MIERKIKYNLKYKPRQYQIDTLNFVKHQVRRGKKYMLINSPTGTGKSFFAVMFINWYLNHINEDARFDIITNSKILQNQYVNEFPFMKSLKGKNNYTCHTYNCSCQEGKELNKSLKRKCTGCPYDFAFEDWITTGVGLTNFHLFDTLHLFVPGHLERKDTNVLIIDEADQFESVLSDYISLKISERSLKLLGFNDNKMRKVKTEIREVRTVSGFIDFINNFFINELDMQLENMKSLLSKTKITHNEKLKTSKYITNLEGTIELYKNYVKSIDNGQDNIDNWVIEIEKDDTKKKKIFPISYLVQPIWSHKYLKEVIFDHYDHIIFMSGTILDKNIFSHLNGLETNLSSYFSIDSPFPVKNRPLYYLKGVGKMTYTNKNETFKNQIKYLNKIIKKHNTDKGIIHTVNYEISLKLQEVYKNNERFIFHTPEERDEALQRHLKSKTPTILVSPSMMNGIDLKDDLSRFQVILKMPYGNIKSNKIKKRQKDYPEWYNWRTCCNLIQMQGRSIRSEEDYAKTYILDDSFGNILKYNHKFLPGWYIESIKILK